MTRAQLLEPDEIERRLEERLGRVHARQRLGIEREHESQAFGQGLTFFHLENLPVSHAIIESVLRLSGMFWVGRANATRVEVRTNEVVSERLPRAFDGFTILHLSDLHADMSARAMVNVSRLAAECDYDLCVLTGDYRGHTFGDIGPSLSGLRHLREAIKTDVYAVLGNHDSILMVPDLERMGVNVLLNENAAIERSGARIFLAGIDDAHFFRVDNIEKAIQGIPESAYSILLSHTPEIFRQAAHAGFELLLSGHTHGGQICLPGGVPLTLDADLPRRMGRGPWRYAGMEGYTSAGAGSSIVPVRFNCPPEITLHRLRKGDR
jgi:predicted MPP superfamily phosphohydrolase